MSGGKSLVPSLAAVTAALLIAGLRWSVARSPAAPGHLETFDWEFPVDPAAGGAVDQP